MILSGCQLLTDNSIGMIGTTSKNITELGNLIEYLNYNNLKNNRFIRIAFNY